MSKKDALDAEIPALIMLRHIKTLHQKYPLWKDLPILVIPENNTRHAANQLGEYLQAANLELEHIGGRVDKLTILRCIERDGVTAADLPGITTTNSNKTAAVARIGMRLRKGKTAIAISGRFVTSTPDPDDPSKTVEPLKMLERIRREFLSFQTIPPSMERHTKMVTFSGKVVGSTDDCVSCVLLLECGNVEFERQALLKTINQGISIGQRRM